jgi:ketosteroid isomerase-like protein
MNSNRRISEIVGPDGHRVNLGAAARWRRRPVPGRSTTGFRACHDAFVSDPASVVRRYFEIVADLDSSVDALLAVLHPAVRITEHPNLITPRGAVRDRDAVAAGFLAGKRLLAAQTLDVHELLVSGDRVAVRATWRGTVRRGAPSLPAGTELVAHIAAMLTVKDGTVREHETFDCYEPLPAAGLI